MPEEKKKQYHPVLKIAVLLFILFGLMSFPIKPVQAYATGLPFGGRILFFSPPIVTGLINCPALIAVLSIGGPYKGVFYSLYPPAQPRLFYNFYTSGVAALGSYYPTPLPFNCPFQPIFPTVYFGTSAR